MSSFKHKGRLAPFRFFTALGLGLFAAAGALAQPTVETPLVVTGTLVNEHGGAVAGAEVVLRPYPAGYALDLDLLGEPGALPKAVDRVRSGPDGAFSLSAPLVGPYRLEIRPSPAATGPATIAPVYRRIVPLRVPLHLEPIELPGRHPLTIRALDTGGQPVEGAVVIAVPKATQRTGNPPYRPPHEQPERLYPEFERAAARTDAQGIARFLMPSQAADVVVSASGFAAQRTNVESGRAALRLDPAAETTLRVRRPDGEPANRAVIRRVSGADEVPVALTDENGLAAIGVGANEPATLVAEAFDGSSIRTKTRNQPARESASQPSVQELLLQPPAVISGRIADATTGLGVPDSVVWVRSDPGRHTVADPSGGFRLSNPLPQRSIELGAVAGDYVATTVTVNAHRTPAGAGALVGLAPAAPLAGWVVDGFGRPVAGAHVQSEPADDEPLEWRTDRHGRATSGPDGSFWIPNAVYNSGYRLTVEAPSYAPAQHDLPPFERASLVEPIRIVLTQGRQPWGTVVDPEGALVAGAEIRLSWPSEYPELRAGFQDDEAVGAVHSSNRGEFEFATVAPGQYRVGISHPEYVELEGKPVNIPHGAGYFDLGIFVLTPGAAIYGVVSDPDQDPVKGVQISARQRSQGLSRQTRTTTTDARGRFRLGGLLTVLADLTATADGYAPTAVESVRPATGEPILIELARGASLSGRVFSPEGSTAAGVEVHLSVPYTEFRRLAVSGEHFFHSTRTDHDGRFRFDQLVPAKWSLEAADETARATQEGIELGSGASREVELQLEIQDQLNVIVTNHLGAPVANAEVKVTSEGPAEQRERARTDAGGRANLQVETGTATVEVSHAALLTRSHEVLLEAGRNELHMQLDPGWEIKGSVLSVDGRPIAGATVEAGQASELSEALRLNPTYLRFRRLIEPPTQTTSGADGRFRLTGLDRGRYHLVARFAGYTEAEVPGEVEINDRSVADVTIVLEPGAAIRGLVTGLDAGDMAAVGVEAWQGNLFRSTSPDLDGGFSLEALAPGTWQLSATTGERRSPMQSVTVDPGAANATVELRFQPGFRLTGQVFVAGAPASNGFVTASQPGQENPRRTRTDHQGRFEMKGLAAGGYQLQVRHPLGATAEQALDLRSDYYNLLVHLQPRPDGQN